MYPDDADAAEDEAVRNSSAEAIVIATGAPPANQRYLIQFTVTGYAEEAADEAPDVEEIIEGFTVEVP